MSDDFYTRAEFLIAKGYLPGMSISKLAEKLRLEVDLDKNKETVTNTRTSVFQDQAFVEEFLANINPESKELISEIERVNAVANGNIKAV